MCILFKIEHKFEAKDAMVFAVPAEQLVHHPKVDEKRGHVDERRSRRVQKAPREEQRVSAKESSQEPNARSRVRSIGPGAKKREYSLE